MSAGAGPVRAQSIRAESSLAVQLDLGRHVLIGDEPELFGGKDLGPAPYQLLCAALAECTVMWLGWQARRQGLPVDRLLVEVEHMRVASPGEAVKKDRFLRRIRIEGEALNADQRAFILAQADGCPVHHTLGRAALIETEAA